MKDRSNNPLHHEWTLYHRATSLFLLRYWSQRYGVTRPSLTDHNTMQQQLYEYTFKHIPVLQSINNSCMSTRLNIFLCYSNQKQLYEYTFKHIPVLQSINNSCMSTRLNIFLCYSNQKQLYEYTFKHIPVLQSINNSCMSTLLNMFLCYSQSTTAVWLDF